MFEVTIDAKLSGETDELLEFSWALLHSPKMGVQMASCVLADCYGNWTGIRGVQNVRRTFCEPSRYVASMYDPRLGVFAG